MADANEHPLPWFGWALLGENGDAPSQQHFSLAQVRRYHRRVRQ